MITFKDLVSLRTDVFDHSKVKYVRHKDNRQEYRELIKDRDELLKYQKYQKNNVFKNCEYIISFVGKDGTKSLFIGVFKVGKVYKKNNAYYYDLIEEKGFDDFKDRVVVDWGSATLSWHQWYSNTEKEVVEILPKGFFGHFPGLLEFSLDFYDLKKLVNNVDANKDWFNNLKSVNGIYLILDSKTGNQYIGSASGKEGIWQRWASYTRDGHGGNILLKDLCLIDSEYYKNFRFSILQTLPSNILPKEVVKIENLYKVKLGTKSFGLNQN